MTVPVLEEDKEVENGQKLDILQDSMTELRVSMAQLSGDVRASLARHDRQDVVTADVERRIRSLETAGSTVPEAESQRRTDVERRIRGLEATTATVPADVESRLRSLEHRLYAIPSLAALLGAAGFALALWATFHK